MTIQNHQVNELEKSAATLLQMAVLKFVSTTDVKIRQSVPGPYLEQAIVHLHRCPDTPSVRNLLGEVFSVRAEIHKDAYLRSDLASDDYCVAAEHYHQANELEKSATVLLQANSQFALKTEAMQDTENPLKKVPNSVEAISMRNQLKTIQTHIANGMKSYLNDKNYSQAMCHFNEGRFEEALRGYNTVLKQMPTDIPSQCYRVMSLVKLGQLDEAKASFTKISEKLKQHPNSEHLHFLMQKQIETALNKEMIKSHSEKINAGIQLTGVAVIGNIAKNKSIKKEISKNRITLEESANLLENIKYRRLEKGISVRELASRFYGDPLRELSLHARFDKIKCGRQATLEFVNRMASCLECSPQDLLATPTANRNSVKNFLANLKYHMQDKSISLNQLGEKVYPGDSSGPYKLQDRLNKIKSSTTISANFINKIAAALQCPPETLFKTPKSTISIDDRTFMLEKTHQLTPAESANFLENVEHVMREKGMSKAKLAETIYRYSFRQSDLITQFKEIKNGRQPTYKYVNKIAEGLQCSPKRLLAPPYSITTLAGKDFLKEASKKGMSMQKISLITSIPIEKLDRVINKGLTSFNEFELISLMEKGEFNLPTLVSFASDKVDVISLVEDPELAPRWLRKKQEWIYQRKALSRALHDKGMNITQLSEKTKIPYVVLEHNILWHESYPDNFPPKQVWSKVLSEVGLQYKNKKDLIAMGKFSLSTQQLHEWTYSEDLFKVYAKTLTIDGEIATPVLSEHNLYKFYLSLKQQWHSSKMPLTESSIIDTIRKIGWGKTSLDLAPDTLPLSQSNNVVSTSIKKQNVAARKTTTYKALLVEDPVIRLSPSELPLPTNPPMPPVVKITQYTSRENILLNVKSNLRMLMDAKRVSLENLAKQTEIKPFILKNILSEGTDCSYTTYKIAHFFEYDIDTFIHSTSNQLAKMEPTLPKGQVPLSKEQFHSTYLKKITIFAKQKAVAIPNPEEILNIHEFQRMAHTLNTKMGTLLMTEQPSTLLEGTVSTSKKTNVLIKKEKALAHKIKLTEGVREKILAYLKHEGLTFEQLSLKFKAAGGGSAYFSSFSRFMLGGSDVLNTEVVYHMAELFNTNSDRFVTASVDDLFAKKLNSSDLRKMNILNNFRTNGASKECVTFLKSRLGYSESQILSGRDYFVARDVAHFKGYDTHTYLSSVREQLPAPNQTLITKLLKNAPKMLGLTVGVGLLSILPAAALDLATEVALVELETNGQSLKNSSLSPQHPQNAATQLGISIPAILGHFGKILLGSNIIHGAVTSLNAGEIRNALNNNATLEPVAPLLQLYAAHLDLTVGAAAGYLKNANPIVAHSKECLEALGNLAMSAAETIYEGAKSTLFYSAEEGRRLITKTKMEIITLAKEVFQLPAAEEALFTHQLQDSFNALAQNEHAKDANYAIEVEQMLKDEMLYLDKQIQEVEQEIEKTLHQLIEEWLQQHKNEQAEPSIVAGSLFDQIIKTVFSPTAANAAVVTASSNPQANKLEKSAAALLQAAVLKFASTTDVKIRQSVPGQYLEQAIAHLRHCPDTPSIRNLLGEIFSVRAEIHKEAYLRPDLASDDYRVAAEHYHQANELEKSAAASLQAAVLKFANTTDYPVKAPTQPTLPPEPIDPKAAAVNSLKQFAAQSSQAMSQLLAQRKAEDDKKSRAYMSSITKPKPIKSLSQQMADSSACDKAKKEEREKQRKASKQSLIGYSTLAGSNLGQRSNGNSYSSVLNKPRSKLECMTSVNASSNRPVAELNCRQNRSNHFFKNYPNRQAVQAANPGASIRYTNFSGATIKYTSFSRK